MTLNDGYAYQSRIQQGGLRLLDFLSGAYRHSSPEVWGARLLAGELVLDGVVVQQDVVLRAGQVLVWRRPPWREEAVPLHFDVVYEFGGVLAVSKPSGLPTVPGGGFLQHTLLSLVRERWPAASPLHRLGRGTSGLVLFSLTAEAGSRLLADWRSQRVRKVYLALACGQAALDEYDIHTPIGAVPHPKLGEVFAASPGGKAAHSRATVLERRADGTLFQVEIFSGRPHQIRIHLASIGYPLCGDPLYLPGGSALHDALPGDLGYNLHAWQLEFTHPATGELVKLEVPAPF